MLRFITLRVTCGQLYGHQTSQSLDIYANALQVKVQYSTTVIIEYIFGCGFITPVSRLSPNVRLLTRLEKVADLSDFIKHAEHGCQSAIKLYFNPSEHKQAPFSERKHPAKVVKCIIK